MDQQAIGARQQAQGLMLQARFSDLDEFAGALRHDEVELVDLGRSGGLNGVDLVLLPDMLARIGHQATPWDCIARSPDNALSIVFSWGYSVTPRVYGQALGEGAFSLSGPGTEYVSSVKGSGRYLFLPIPLHLLDERMLGEARGDVLRTGFKQVGTADPAASAMLRNTLAMLTRHGAETPVSEVDERLRRNLQNALLSAVHYVIAPTLATTEREPRSFVQRTRMFRTASEFLRHAEPATLNVFALCHALHVPLPALRALFQEFTGLSPEEFLVRFRLQRMHRALRTMSPTAETVRDAALDAGFCETARAEQVYRRFEAAPGIGLIARSAA